MGTEKLNSHALGSRRILFKYHPVNSVNVINNKKGINHTRYEPFNRLKKKMPAINEPNSNQKNAGIVDMKFIIIGLLSKNLGKVCHG